MRAITEAEFKEWLEHPVTQAVKAILEKKREQMRQDWEGGSFTDYESSTTALINVGNIGTCKGYAFVQELDYVGYTTEIEDDKPIGAGTSGSGSAGEAVRT